MTNCSDITILPRDAVHSYMARCLDCLYIHVFYRNGYTYRQTVTFFTAGSTILVLSRVNTLMRETDTAILSVCLSVRPLRSGILWKRLTH